MLLLELVLLLMLCSVGLGWLARHFGFPYPVALVVGGALLGLIPKLPQFPFDPQMILLVVLPPVLYQAALLTSWADFKAHIRPISLLAIGLVIATTLAVGVAVVAGVAGRERAGPAHEGRPERQRAGLAAGETRDARELRPLMHVLDGLPGQRGSVQGLALEVRVRDRRADAGKNGLDGDLGLADLGELGERITHVCASWPDSTEEGPRGLQGGAVLDFDGERHRRDAALGVVRVDAVPRDGAATNARVL